MEILKIIFLFLVAWQGPIVILRNSRQQSVTWKSLLLLAVGLTGFVYLQFIR